MRAEEAGAEEAAAKEAAAEKAKARARAGCKAAVRELLQGVRSLTRRGCVFGSVCACAVLVLHGGVRSQEHESMEVYMLRNGRAGISAAVYQRHIGVAASAERGHKACGPHEEVWDELRGSKSRAPAYMDPNNELLMLRGLDVVDSIADAPTLLCLVYTSRKLHDQALAAAETWLPFCDGSIVASDLANDTIPTVVISGAHADQPEAYTDLWRKVNRFVRCDSPAPRWPIPTRDAAAR